MSTFLLNEHGDAIAVNAINPVNSNWGYIDRDLVLTTEPSHLQIMPFLGLGFAKAQGAVCDRAQAVNRNEGNGGGDPW